MGLHQVSNIDFTLRSSFVFALAPFWSNFSPPPQPLFGPGYTGMIRIRVWRYGHWQSVYIDDRLPQRDGKHVYGHCSDPREFWVALLEKAVAKLHGSYEVIGEFGKLQMQPLDDHAQNVAIRKSIPLAIQF